MHKVVTINLNGQAYQFDDDVVAWPLHMARRASYHALGGSICGWDADGYGLISAALAALLIWLAYQNVPEVREFAQRLPAIWEDVRRAIAEAR